jgi:hypothetical protein
VVFKIEGKTCGEIEIYREVKFWLDRNLITFLLKQNIKPVKNLNKKILLYGLAINKLSK